MQSKKVGVTPGNDGSRGARNQQTAMAGQFFVVAELCRRGAYAVTFAGNMPRIDILASNTDQTRTVQIQVKSKRKGTWQAHFRLDQLEEAISRPEDPSRFWVLVDIGEDNSQPPRHWIVPERRMLEIMCGKRREYLARPGDLRAKSPDWPHNAIVEKDLPQDARDVEGGWERLGILS